MKSVNKVILIGNLTRNPELKSTSGGQYIVNFGMATNRNWKTSTGEQRSSAEFHEVVAWAKLAEICNDFLKKGMLVYVEGYLKTRTWDTEDGTRRYRTEIVAQDMLILEKRGGGNDDYSDSGYQESMGSSSMGDAQASDDSATAGDDATGDDAAASDDDASDEATASESTEATPASTGGLNVSIDDDEDMF